MNYDISISLFEKDHAGGTVNVKINFISSYTNFAACLTLPFVARRKELTLSLNDPMKYCLAPYFISWEIKNLTNPICGPRA